MNNGIFEVVASCFMVEILDELGEPQEVFTMGPFDDEQQEDDNARQLLTTLRSDDKIVKATGIDSEVPDDYREAYYLALNSEGLPTVVIWLLDHKE